MTPCQSLRAPHDDGSNVAAILEIARVLKTGAQPRNDIEILFTDGEEQGLLGAQAFVDAEAGPARPLTPAGPSW